MNRYHIHILESASKAAGLTKELYEIDFFATFIPSFIAFCVQMKIQIENMRKICIYNITVDKV